MEKKKLSRIETPKIMSNIYERLVNLHRNRNLHYATGEASLSNFHRNAEWNRIFRMEKIINEPWGVCLHYALQKIDRAINRIVTGVVTPNSGAKDKDALKDDFDDATVYVNLARMCLMELGYLDVE